MFEIIQTILIQEFEIDKEEISPKSNLRNDLHIDSLAAVNLFFELEKKFDVEIKDEELANIKTVQDIVDLLESKNTVSRLE